MLADDKVMVLDGEQFEELLWPAVYRVLNDLPRMFQIWACKQMTGVVGTNVMQARYTPNHDKKCPRCGVEAETCPHVLTCNEEGTVDLLHKSISMVDTWLKNHGTDKRLRRCLMEYAHKQGGATMQEIVGDRSGPYQQLMN